MNKQKLIKNNFIKIIKDHKPLKQLNTIYMKMFKII